ncbi:MAG: hypothetical protein ACLSVD_14335 [Eggerthellaceae bacterium]
MVASLAVSVTLVVVAGSTALYLAPLSDRASSSRGAGSGADIVVSAHPDYTTPREGTTCRLRRRIRRVPGAGE